ncbi:hypothetical protein CKO15_11100 [Halorhodospira abdelmalekii]|uniref:type VII toxin-antitoxin system HepT family RNase toxin n=1 Tax=Halorhodospira abdelmalekii TaxID=421629 RepID=UPI001904EE84|nr:DUF86 domain-containing protein [Halorhodospira abdelmalekii]MBK1735814.1 hypothetical protein [Halorhodospira abdelmalekii]
MDRVILAEKLEALHRCVRRIEERRTASVSALREDIDRQDILSVNLTRAVQLCVDMAAHVLSDTCQPAPQTMGEAFDLLCAEGIIDAEVRDRMRAAVGFRNVAVHSYQAIDWDIVHHITHEGLTDFRAFARSMAALLDQS